MSNNTGKYWANGSFFNKLMGDLSPPKRWKCPSFCLCSESNLPGWIGGALPDYLQRMPSGEWRARVPVPKRLVCALGKTAFTRKCGTTDHEKAKSDPQTKTFIKNRLTEIAEADRQLRGDIGSRYTFYGDPGSSFGSGIRIVKGTPSLDMTPVFDESGGIAGYRLRRSTDPPAPFVDFDELVAMWVSRPGAAKAPSSRARAAVMGKMKRLEHSRIGWNR